MLDNKPSSFLILLEKNLRTFAFWWCLCPGEYRSLSPPPRMERHVAIVDTHDLDDGDDDKDPAFFAPLVTPLTTTP